MFATAKSVVSEDYLSQPLIKKANVLKVIPRVARLPPRSVRPCDLPPPEKYVVGYSIALVIEGISLVFMLGRVIWLGSGIGKVPILKALGTQ